jgi:hypothetical protein
MTCLSDAQVQMLAHLACASRPHGAKRWDEPGVVVGIRKLMERGFGMQEVIDRTFAHAWDGSANTPGTLLTPKRREPEVSNPAPFPATRADECPLHPGQPRGTCVPCAADALLGDRTGRPARMYDADGNRLRHRPIRELFDETLAEIGQGDE